MWNVIGDLLAVGTPVALAGALLFGALANPQKTVYWIGKGGAVFGWASAGVARKALAGRLESRINSFAVTSYRTIQHVDPNGAKISWVGSDAEVECALTADGDVVVYLNPAKPEGENLSRAALMYVSRKFVPRSKLYMTPRQRESMDLFVTGRLLDQASPDIASEFFSKFMGPATLSDEKMSTLVEIYNVMDRAGLFFPVFIQELVFMGEKVALGGARKEVENEVRLLLAFLSSRANRVVGDETVPMSYEGQFCKCGLVIVAKADKLAAQGIDPYVQSVSSYWNDGFENIYIIGGPNSGAAIDQIVAAAEAQTRLIEVVRKEYDTQVQHRPGQWHATRNVLALLRSSSVQRYMSAPREALAEGDLTA